MRKLLGKNYSEISIGENSILISPLLMSEFVKLSIANKESRAETDIDPSLGNEFEDDYSDLHEDYEDDEDFGEKEALKQQEALLKEMMNQSNLY